MKGGGDSSWELIGRLRDDLRALLRVRSEGHSDWIHRRAHGVRKADHVIGCASVEGADHVRRGGDGSPGSGAAGVVASADRASRTVVLDIDRAAVRSVDFGARRHTDAGVWDWARGQLSDWPVKRVDDAGLTVADTVSYALQSTRGRVQVELRSTGDRGNRELHAVVRDTGTTAPPQDVLDDTVHGHLDYRLHPGGETGWTREISLRMPETRPLPQWLDQAIDPTRYPRLSVDGETAIAVRSRDYSKLARDLAPYDTASPAEVARHNNDVEIRHQGRVNDARLWAGRTNLEPAYFALKSGDGTADLAVYPLRNQNFAEGLTQLGITSPGEKLIPVDDFATSIAEQLQQRPRTLPEETEPSP